MKTLSTNLNLRSASEKEKRAIRRALRILEKSESPCHAAQIFQKRGWLNRTAAFKSAYIKDGIVVKIGPKEQIQKEFKRWKRYYGKKHRKYITRAFGVISYKNTAARWSYEDERVYYLIQREVPRAGNCKLCYNGHSICEKVASKLRIPDWWHNHGYLDDGTPVWFDTILD